MKRRPNTNKIKVCIVCRNTIANDRRTITEARILAEAGMEVVVIGLLGANQDPLEQRNGFCIRRIRASLQLIPVFRNPLLRWLNQPLNTLTIYVQLFKATLAEKADYYHAHFPALLMFLTFLTAKLKSRRFIADYNDILVLEQGVKGSGYYEQGVLWGGELSEREQSRVSSTMKLIPKGVNSLLDIGCGDGRLTNKLAEVYPRVTGLDISEKALQYVRTEKTKASVEILPFENGSFDLVLSTELIEHLPHCIYQKAVAEMKRVARNWILIGVPWKEQLSIAQGWCIRCRVKFHVNYHYRNFNVTRLRTVFAPEFAIVTYQHAGASKTYYAPWLLWIKRHFGGIWTRTPMAICPRCRTHIYSGGFFERNAVSKFCDEWNERTKGRKTLPMSHVVALYRRIKE